MITIKVDGWDSIPDTVKDDVREYIKPHGFEIVNGGFLHLGDILMDVEHGGYHDWAEHVKAYVGSVIYILLYRYLRFKETGINDVELNMPAPGAPRLDMDRGIN